MTASTSDFAHTIRTLRLRAGLSQEELAERAGVSARAISDMERGLRKTPRPETLRLLADALELEVDARASFFAAAHADSEASGQSNKASPASSGGKATALPLTIRPLPRPVDALIGREDAVQAILSLLESEQVRLVTLTGPGGVGKTRLCLEVASQIRSRFAEGAAFVDLASLSEPSLIAPAISEAVGLIADPQMNPIESLLAALRDRSVLLLLDNFEHLLDAAPILSTLLAGCPLLTILATSRVRLRLRGEHVVAVQPLQVPEPATDAGSFELVAHNPSVRLFVDRAQEAQFGFALTGQNAAAVADICRRLDGLPLAIELAASRVGTITPAVLQARLQNRLPSLTGGPRDAPARQRTLRNAMAWSYDLLDPAQQRVFRQLSVFSGGFTLASATFVVGSSETDTAAVLEALAECSLLAPRDVEADEARWTMLDTISEYAATMLEESGEAAAARRQHADWSIQLAALAGADLLGCRNEVVWYRTLDTELANLRGAMEFMLASGDGTGGIELITGSFLYWLHRPYPHDLRRWIERALALSPELTPDAEMVSVGCLSWALSVLGDSDAARGAADRGLALANACGTPLLLAMAYYMRATVAEFSGQVEQAIADYEQSLACSRESGQPSLVMGAMFEVAGRRLQLGKVAEAVTILDEGLALARKLDAQPNLAYGLLHRGFAAIEQNDWRLAGACFREGLELSQRFRMDRDTLALVGGLSGVALSLGMPESAARLQGAIEAARRSGGFGRIAEAASVEVIRRATQSQLGSGTYEVLLLEGTTMSYDEAIAAAFRIAADAEPLSNQRVQAQEP